MIHAMRDGQPSSKAPIYRIRYTGILPTYSSVKSPLDERAFSQLLFVFCLWWRYMSFGM